MGIVEDEQGARQLVQLLQVACLHPVRPGAPQVPDVGTQRCERALTPTAGEVGPQAARHVRVLAGMGPAGPGVEVGALGEPVGGELPDRLQHRDPRLAARQVHPAEQALLDEAGQPVEDVQGDAIDLAQVLGHRLDRGDLRVREHRHQLVQPLLPGLQELVAPVHRRAQRLLPLREVARPAAEQAQPVAQSIPEHVGREQAQARRRQLDRQGQAVQAAADLGHGRSVVVGQLEVGPDDLRPIHEQLDCLVAADPARGRSLAPFRRQGERRDRVHLLCPHVERLPAGREHRQPGALAEQAGDHAGRFGDLLEVVEHEQRSPVPEPVDELVLQRALDDLAEPGRARDRHQDGVRVPAAGQVDEGHAIGEAGREIPGHPDRQRGLAGAAGADQREQAHGAVLEAGGDPGDLVLPADQLGDPRRQVRAGRACRDQGWEL